MAIVHETTDAGKPELEEAGFPPADTVELDPAEWAAVCALTRTEDPPPAITVEPFVFVEQEAARHRDRACDEGPRGTHRLVAGELALLACSLRFYRKEATTTAAFCQLVPRFRGLDLTRVSIPDHWSWDSKLAVDVLEEGVLYTTLYHSLGCLVGRLLIDLAEDVEGYGSETADAYLRDLAEAREAAIEAMNEGI